MRPAKIRRFLLLPIFVSVGFIINHSPALASECFSPDVVVTALSQDCPNSQCL